MKLHIEFFEERYFFDERSQKPFWTQKRIDSATCDRDVPLEQFHGRHLPKGQSSIKWGGSDTVFIEARLDDFGQDEVDELFQLSLAFNPDYQPLSDEQGRFFYEDKENKRKVRRMQLLRGAAGKSYLRLLKRPSPTPEAEFLEIIRYEIDVEPAPSKKAAMDLMVDELLKDEPTLALSIMHGLSMASLKMQWEAGAGSLSLWRLETKCKEMEKVIMKLHPHLNAIRNRYAMQLIRKQGTLNISRISRWSPRETRQLAHRYLDERQRIKADTLDITLDIPIHRAIKDFLVGFVADIHVMTKKIKASIKEDNDRSDELNAEIAGNGKLNSVYQFELQAIRVETELKTEFLKRLKSLCSTCQSWLTNCYPWFSCGRIDVTNVTSANVPETIAYKCVYSHMLRFRQKKFFKEAIGGHFLLPHYERDANETPSSWQKNYSYIYESWVFLRLAKAFCDEGFEDFGQSFRNKIKRSVKAIHLGPTVNEPIHATSRDGKLQIDLFYGIRAYHQSSSKCPEFFSVWTDKNKSLETPDFVIVFTNPNGEGDHYFNWIVLDAKSGQKLSKGDIIDARDKYARTMRRWDEQVMPDQSWLIYSGELSDHAYPDIEFDPNENEILPTWKIDFNPFSVENKGMTWHPEQGIEGWTNSRGQPRGHIRANILTIGKHDIFRDFARGQIATARKRLGL